MENDQKARLDELRARRAKLEEEMEARERAALEVTVEEEERRLAEAETISKLQLEHGPGKLLVVESDGGTLVIKRPHHLVYNRFRDSETKAEDTHRFVRACLVYPDKAKAEQLLEEYPALVDRLALELHKLAAGRRQEVRGK